MGPMRRRPAILASLSGLLAAAAAALAAGSGGSPATAAAQILPTPTPGPTITPTPTPTPTATPAPTQTAPPAPPAPPAGPTGPPQSEVLVPELASDLFASPRMTLRWRGRGEDDARAAGFFVDVRQVGLRRAADWRTLVPGSPARGTVFTGAPGEAYAVRVRAHEPGTGAYGPPATATVLVPLDERDRHVKLSRGWTRRHRAGAWDGATASSASGRATARLRFAKRRVRVIVRRTPSSGSLAVVLDGRRSVVPLAGPAGSRQVAFDSGLLRRGKHRLALKPAGGRVEIDAIAPG
jgi:hypothetical protein